MVLGLAIIILFLIIAIPFVLAYAGDAVNDIFQNVEERKDARDFGNNPRSGDLVCDLIIRTGGQLDFDRTGIEFIEALRSNVIVYMGTQGNHPYIAEYEWKNCRDFGNFSLLSFLSNIQNLRELTLIRGESFDLVLTGKSLTTGKPMTEDSNKKSWTKEIKITDSFIPIIELAEVDFPVSWEMTYYLTDVKADDYRISIIALGGSINNMNTNSPLKYNLCHPSKTSC